MTQPMAVGELLPGVLQEVIDRAGRGYDRWAEQVAATGYCAHPVRLRGRVDQTDAGTGEVRTVYSTDREPDATLLTACGNRRASVVRPARRPTRPTSSTSSPLVCGAARVSARRWPAIPGCS
jgi:hypothetical protein